MLGIIKKFIRRVRLYNLTVIHKKHPVSDYLAIGALKSIKQAGLKIPENISLVGFDGLEFAAYCDPPLTTVRVPANKMGRLAVNILLDTIDHDVSQPKQYCK